MALLKGHASASAPAQAARAGKPTRAPSCRVNSRHDQVAKDSAIVLECQSTSSSSVGVGRREALRSVLLTGIATGMVAFLAPPPLPSSAKVSIASVMKGEDGERDIQMTARQVATDGSHGVRRGPGARGTRASEQCAGLQAGCSSGPAETINRMGNLFACRPLCMCLSGGSRREAGLGFAAHHPAHHPSCTCCHSQVVAKSPVLPFHPAKPPALPLPRRPTFCISQRQPCSPHLTRAATTAGLPRSHATGSASPVTRFWVVLLPSLYRASTPLSGIRTSLVSPGRGEAPRSGGLVVAHVVGSLEDGTVFLDTRVGGRRVGQHSRHDSGEGAVGRRYGHR